MRLWRRTGAWIRALARRGRVEGEMEEELRFHLEARVEDLVRGGMEREEAGADGVWRRVAGHDQVVVLSYELWQRQFGLDSGIVGKKVNVEGLPYTVIGVMPRGFSFPRTKAELWTPLPLARTKDFEEGRYLSVVARLKPGVTLENAREDMRRAAEMNAEARPNNDKGWSAEVAPMLEDATQDVRRPLWVLLASVGFLLLIACANVANLLLMRGAGRMREMAVRSALGAGRLRIVRQLLMESALLSFAGMAAGLIFAQLGLHSLLTLIPEGAPLPRSEPIAIDARVLLFTPLPPA